MDSNLVLAIIGIKSIL